MIGGLTVGAAVAGLGSGLVSAYVVPLAAEAAEAAQRLPKFVARGASIKDEAEVAAAMEDVAAGECRVMNIGNWPDVLCVLRAGGGGFIVPSEKSRSADSYFIGADYAIGIQQKDNRESGSLTRASIGAEAAVAFPQALLGAVKVPCSFVVAQTATPPSAARLLESAAPSICSSLLATQHTSSHSAPAYRTLAASVVVTTVTQSPSAPLPHCATNASKQSTRSPSVTDQTTRQGNAPTPILYSYTTAPTPSLPCTTPHHTPFGQNFNGRSKSFHFVP